MDVFTIQIGWIGGYKSKIIPPIPPAPVIQVPEARRWPGPSTILYSEPNLIPNWQRKREDEEIILL
jgi:hypothetical protein